MDRMNIVSKAQSLEVATLNETAKNHAASIDRLTLFLKTATLADAESAKVALDQHQRAAKEIAEQIKKLT
jgi:hypothetical protein